MSIWDHLFLTGEFRAREDLLSGLTLEQVTLRPAGASHSIFEELWHAATIQRCVVERDKALDALLRGGANYPSAAPDHEQQWHDLVLQFLEGARAAVAWAQAPDRLEVEVEPGVTMGQLSMQRSARSGLQNESLLKRAPANRIIGPTVAWCRTVLTVNKLISGRRRHQ